MKYYDKNAYLYVYIYIKKKKRKPFLWLWIVVGKKAANAVCWGGGFDKGVG